MATEDEDTDDADDDVISSQDSATGGVSGGAIGTEKLSLLEMFKMSADEWDCGVCYVRNKTDAKQCVACETAKPGCEEEVEKEKDAQKQSAAGM